MPGRRDIDQLLVAWLDTEAAGAPPAYLDETLGRLDRTPQRRLLRQGFVVFVRGAAPVARPEMPWSFHHENGMPGSLSDP